jgi:hypothetical protein
MSALPDAFDHAALRERNTHRHIAREGSQRRGKSGEKGRNEDFSVSLDVRFVYATHPSLHELLRDRDVLAQQICVEIRHHLGIHSKLSQRLEL